MIGDKILEPVKIFLDLEFPELLNNIGSTQVLLMLKNTLLVFTFGL